MKILFVHPPSRMGHEDVALQRIKSSSPSLGLLQLASIARNHGHKVKFFDRRFSLRETIYFKPDLVAITAMTNEIESAASVARQCHLLKAKVVIGGCHVTAEPEKTREVYPELSNLVEGEGERPFTEMIGGDPEQYGSMDDLPDPAFDLIDWSQYKLSPFGCKKERSIGLVTSRGCFGKCTFCSRKVFGNKFRGYSVSRLIEMLERIRKDFGIDDFLFYDDLFTGNRKRLVEFCETILAKNLPYTWSVCSRVDVLDLPTMQLIKQAGCWLIEYGIESGSQKILDSIKKRIKKEQIINTLQITRKAGIISKGNFILGLPGETKETLQETIDFARKAPLDLMQHTFFAPLPGTEAYEHVSEYGEFNDSWSSTSTFAINFVPNGLTRETLLEASRKLFRSFYFNPKRLWKIFRMMSLKQMIEGAKTLYAVAFRKSSIA